MYKPYRILNVLIACEESQAETIAFRKLGHNAFSCDILPCAGLKHPEWHIKGDVSPFLKGDTSFTTSDGMFHVLSHWDLIIAHPPCTYLSKVGLRWLYHQPNAWRYTNKGWQFVNLDRWEKMLAAKSFFLSCLNAVADYVAVENPIPMAVADLPKANAYANPAQFGEKYSKKTLYWLKNLPPLMPQIYYPCPRSLVYIKNGKYRSRTLKGLAAAVAKQWSEFILDEYRCIDNMPEKTKLSTCLNESELFSS